MHIVSILYIILQQHLRPTHCSNLKLREGEMFPLSHKFQSLKIEILQDSLHLSIPPAEIDHTCSVANINVYFEDHEHRIIAKTLRHLSFLGHLRLPFRFLAYSLQ